MAVKKPYTDYQKIRSIVEEVLDEKLDEKLEEKLAHLPTRQEFNQRMDKLYAQNDKIIKELDDMRAENTVGAHQTSDHEERIVNLERIHPHGKHTPAGH